jgi:hypothetical protein
MSHFYSKEKHGYGYEGIYKFIAEKNDCVEFIYEQMGSYQGDAVACFVRKDGQVGILDHAYGSCSGCDDYEASNDYSEKTPNGLTELADEYEKKVKWSSAEDALKRCEELWLEGQAGYHLDNKEYTECYRKRIPNFINKHTK